MVTLVSIKKSASWGKTNPTYQDGKSKLYIAIVRFSKNLTTGNDILLLANANIVGSASHNCAISINLEPMRDVLSGDDWDERFADFSKKFAKACCGPNVSVDDDGYVGHNTDKYVIYTYNMRLLLDVDAVTITATGHTMATRSIVVPSTISEDAALQQATSDAVRQVKRGNWVVSHGASEEQD